MVGTSYSEAAAAPAHTIPAEAIAANATRCTAQERQVIEQGFATSSFDACFATSTLAAGVNFPFRSVVFPKLTYQWGDREGRMIALSDYRNMSGRAGRLGLHPDGYAVLLPKNAAELAHANRLVLPTNENLESKMVRLSMRRTVLSLIASRVVDSRMQDDEQKSSPYQKRGGVCGDAESHWL